MNREELLDCVELQTGPKPCGSVLWLHGLGADGHDFEPIVPELGLPPELALRFVFPHAPVIPVTVNAGMPMRAWYDIDSLELDRKQDEAGILRSAEQVRLLLKREQELGFTAERIVLAGFSQGGAIASYVGLRYPKRLAGILVLSALLLLGETLESEASEANRATPLLHCHGDWDPMVPVALGQHAVDVLAGRDYRIEWRSYPTQHSVHPQEIADVGAWLVRVLGGSSTNA